MSMSMLLALELVEKITGWAGATTAVLTAAAAAGSALVAVLRARRAVLAVLSEDDQRPAIPGPRASTDDEEQEVATRG